MKKKIILNINNSETRVAVLENDRLAEIKIERRSDRSMVGNIYRGKVSRVLPGMQAAFVNIGVERTAFLYAGDIVDQEIQSQLKEERLSPEDFREKHNALRKPIEKMIKDGEEITVQVTKDPLGTKGARISTFLSIPGRYLVLLPNLSHVGISKKIVDEEEKQRLTDLIEQLRENEWGIIARTAAEGATSGQLQKDLKYLIRLWRNIDANRKRMKTPALVFEDLPLTHKTIRDLYNDEVESIHIDDKKTFDDLSEFAKVISPSAPESLKLYQEKTPIFDVYGIEMDISQALGRKVDLPSGGYLIIDQTEALTTFDINTGRFVGQLSARDTILKTNMEAIPYIVSQLRLRNIGGIIVIDFIDMEHEEDKESVFEKFQEALDTDKAKTNVLKISEMGLVQMTRKRSSDSLERKLMDPCPHCQGRGKVRNLETDCYDLLRELVRHSLHTGLRKIKVRIRDDLKSYLENEELGLFEEVTRKHRLKVTFENAKFPQKSLLELPYEVLS